MMATVDFTEKWRLKKNENFHEFLLARNIGVLLRTAPSKQSPVPKITQNGDDLNVVTKSNICFHEVKYKMVQKLTTKDPMQGKEVNMTASDYRCSWSRKWYEGGWSSWKGTKWSWPNSLKICINF